VSEEDTMKTIRKLLARINDIFRPAHVAGEQEGAPGIDDALRDFHEPAPIGWVPSQQDEKPRY